MIYKRENPNTPSKRHSSKIINPLNTPLKKKFFYKIHQPTVGRHFGKKICLRRKKSNYLSKFNIHYGITQNKYSTLSSISIHRRYKTFVGLLTYSNGAVSCLPLYNGAYISQILTISLYKLCNKRLNFAFLKVGSTVPLAFLEITNCIFNIQITAKHFLPICRSAGTFGIIIRYSLERHLCVIKLPSTKHLFVKETSYAMLGRNSNIFPKKIWLGKAGINIKNGFRPAVRGVAKNPVDHPHGGRTKSNSPERTPWGKIAKHNK